MFYKVYPTAPISRCDTETTIMQTYVLYKNRELYFLTNIYYQITTDQRCYQMAAYKRIDGSLTSVEPFNNRIIIF